MTTLSNKQVLEGKGRNSSNRLCMAGSERITKFGPKYFGTYSFYQYIIRGSGTEKMFGVVVFSGMSCNNAQLSP